MFCYQCEQTAGGKGCTQMGVCGKTNEVANLQDLLIHLVKGIGWYGKRLKSISVTDRKMDIFIIESLFTTVTNVDFDPKIIQDWIEKAYKLKMELKGKYEELCRQQGCPSQKEPSHLVWTHPGSANSLLVESQKYTLNSGISRLGETKAGLYHLILYGLKGAAAYADHAQILGWEDNDIYNAFFDSLDFLTNEDASIDQLLSQTLAVGKLNIDVMELLDKANTNAFGHPEPTSVRITPVKGKAILVSGHDLKDLQELLKQTEGQGIHVYTHGEMLPANGYPLLKKYSHLAGNYGGAWQDQQKEFDQFPGAILMTTNCIQKPRPSYHYRIFTSGLVQWPKVKHVNNKDFSPVIKAALNEPGFSQNDESKYITIGFGHHAVLSAAEKIVDAVKKGKIRHFFLIGGCDGAKTGRNYYTEIAQKVPSDCVILTLACGKYRFNKMDFGTIDGIPRLLDIGQCNDAYSAVKIVQALARLFQTDINSLPLSLILSWYEQKAVAILLSLLYLGIQNIKIGPSLPAFIKKPALDILVNQFKLSPITTPEADLKNILG